MKYRGNEKEYLKEYYKNNKERHIERTNQWRINNRDKYRLTRRRYKKRYKIKVNAQTYAQRHQRGNECLICGVIEKLEFHHTSYEFRMGFTACIHHHNEQHRLLKI